MSKCNPHVHKLERQVVKQILARLNAIPGCRAVKYHGGAFGVAGHPDIYGCYHGKSFFFEVKRPNVPNSRLTELQKIELERWESVGAICGEVRSVEDAVRRLLQNE